MLVCTDAQVRNSLIEMKHTCHNVREADAQHRAIFDSSQAQGYQGRLASQKSSDIKLLYKKFGHLHHWLLFQIGRHNEGTQDITELQVWSFKMRESEPAVAVVKELSTILVLSQPRVHDASMMGTGRIPRDC